MVRRLKAYRDINESQVKEPSVQQFFQELQVQLFTKDSSQNSNQLFDSIKIYIERIEKPMNFIDHDAWVETKRRIMVEQDIIQQTDIARKRAIMEEGVEQQLKKQKENHIKQNQQAIREEQKEQLDQKS